MHWFLWILFAVFILNTVIAIAKAGGYDFNKTSTGEFAFKAVVSALIAMGLLVYGGII